MIQETNLRNQSLESWQSFFLKNPVITDLVTVIASIATGALIGAAVAVAASTPIGLTISLGAAAGTLISIAIVAFRRFHRGYPYPAEIKSDALPNSDDVFKLIASHLDFDGFKAFSETSRGCNGMVYAINAERKKAIEGFAFGKKQWLKYWGVSDHIEPTLPRDIVAVLNRPDLEDPTKKMHQTHMLTLILRNQTLTSVNNLLKKWFVYNASVYFDKSLSDQLDKPNVKSYWTLMRKDVLGEGDLVNGSRRKSKDEHNDMLAKLSKDVKANYSLPTVLEAVTSILAHEAMFGEKLFSNEPMTFTRCQELVNEYHNVIVGGFASAGIIVSSLSNNSYIGASGVWRWRPEENPDIGAR